jgi:16S rRNA (guanine1516-N2)-methyltransferase
VVNSQERPLFVSIPQGLNLKFARESLAWASRWNLPISDNLVPAGNEIFLRRDNRGWSLLDSHGELLFSMGLAALRIKRFSRGETDDWLLKFLGLTEGETIVDATFGLGVDAMVMSRALGPNGKVIGLEASLPLAYLAQAGLPLLKRPDSSPVDVVHDKAEHFLVSRSPMSVDCIVLDAMFEKPQSSSQSFDGLRRFACMDPLSIDLLKEARRVARKHVLVKLPRYDQSVKRLGLTLLPMGRHTQCVWACME